MTFSKKDYLDPDWGEALDTQYELNLSRYGRYCDDDGQWRRAFQPVTERNGWTWDKLKATCTYPVEQDFFPSENSGVKLTSPTPCTDGETIWIPKSTFDTQVSFLFHEWAHAELHYPDGPNADLLDPLPRSESVWEFEACMVACQVIERLGLVDNYNSSYLRSWYGKYGNVDLKKISETASVIFWDVISAKNSPPEGQTGE